MDKAGSNVGLRRRTTAVVAGFAVFAVSVGAAMAAPGDLTFKQAFNAFQLNNVSDTVVSPDGKHVYASVFTAGTGAVIAASRNPTTGQLTFLEEYLEITPGIDGIGGAEAIAISPTGDDVYVAGYDSDAIGHAEVEANGQLDFKLPVVNGQNGVTNLGGPMDVAVSPDGLNVYAAANDDDSLVKFTRDLGTGDLGISLGVEINGQNGVSGLNEVRAVSVPPDGKNVYTASNQDSDVTTFTRFDVTGQLDFLETDSNGDATLGARDVVASPDNANVYVAANAGQTVSEWDRAANGALTLGTTIEDGVQTPDLGDPAALAVSGDGKQVYVTADNDNALLTLNRGAGGALTFRSTLKDGQGGVNGLGGADGLSLSPDGLNVYVAASADDRVGVFGREPTPPVVDPPVVPTPLELTVSAKKKQKTKKVAVTATCTIACEISAKAKGKAGGEKLSSKTAKASLAAGAATKVKLKFGKKALKKVAGEKGKATITVDATAGTEAKKQTLKVKLTG